MPRITPVDLDKVDKSTTEILAAVKAKLGALPNIFTTFAQSPVTLSGYLPLTETLAQGNLTSKERELIAIAVAQENGCGYCLSAHAAIGKGEGLNDEDIAQARHAKALIPKDEAIISFALEVLRTQGAVSDEALANIRVVVGGDGNALEIVSNVVLNIMTNYLNRLADTQIDFPIVDMESVA